MAKSRRKGGKVTRALLARAIFAVHSIVAIWRVCTYTQRPIYWVFIGVPLTLFLEGAVTILLRDGDEYKW